MNLDWSRRKALPLLSILLITTAYSSDDIDASKYLSTEVVHCISDPPRHAFRDLEECPPEAYEYRGKCGVAYIDFYKEMVQTEVGGNSEAKLESTARAWEEEAFLSTPKENSYIPRNKTVCIDLDRKCFCIWLNVNRHMCPVIKENSILTVGDSMEQKQMEELERICPGKLLYTAVTRHPVYFFPHRSGRIPSVLNHLHRRSFQVVYIGMGMHFLDWSTNWDGYWSWVNYEMFLTQVLTQIQNVSEAQIVWLHPNTIIPGKWNEEYRENYHKWLRSTPEEEGIKFWDKWKKHTAGGFTRKAIKGKAFFFGPYTIDCININTSGHI